MTIPTVQEVEDFKVDLDDAAAIVNGSTTVTTRLGGDKESLDQLLSKIVVGDVTVYSAAATYTLISDWVEESGVIYRPLPSELPIGPETFDGNKWAVVQGYANSSSETFVDGVDYTAGTSTTITLAGDAGIKANMIVHFDGAFQAQNTYSLSSGTVTFTSAIPVGTDEVYIWYGTSLLTNYGDASSVTLTVDGVGTNVSAYLNAQFVDDYTALIALSGDELIDGRVVSVTDSGIAGEGVLRNSVAHGYTSTSGVIVRINNDWYWIRNGARDSLNPRWWGVKAGSGNDDYQSWTDFLAYYSTQIVVLNPSGGSPIYSAPKVEKMFGLTQVSDRVDFPSYFKGDFDGLIFARHSDWSAPVGRFIVRINDIYLADFGGMTFENEDYCLQVLNANLDKTKITMRGVNATSCNYVIDWETQSGKVSFSDFRFDNCIEILRLKRCDSFVMHDGWITQASLTTLYGATIRNENAHLFIRDVIGVPVPHTGQEVAWINNIDGRVDLDGFRAGGEDGSCTLINNFAQAVIDTDPDTTPKGISIRNGQCYSVDTQGATQVSCIIRLFDLPNYIEYHNNFGHALTEEVITWGIGVATTDKINYVTSQLNNFNFSIKDNLEQKLVHWFPDNLSGLFDESWHYPLYGVAGVAGTLVCDTRIRPRSSQVFELVIKGNPKPTGSADYRAVWKGTIGVAAGLNAAVSSRNLLIQEDFKSPGGATFGNDFTVDVKYYDGASESDFAAISSDSFRLRIKISGWDSGQEGYAFRGYIKRII